MKKNRFIEFIDTYKERVYISPVQYNQVFYEINQNFSENMYYGQLQQMQFQEQHNPELDEIQPVEIVEKPKLKVVIENVEINCITDLIQLAEKYPDDPKVEYNIDLKTIHKILPELKSINQMIGMNSIKIAVLDQLLYFMQKLHVKQSPNSEGDFKHTVIYGPPGTGKTEIAKLIGQMYAKIGALSSNHFKKATRSDLIAGYLGQTAIKTQKLVDECLGGVLFIDEAYSLAPSSESTNADSFSKECIDTLCENLSAHKEDLMVIIAGYQKELEDTFFRANQGLESRFIWRFLIEPYTAIELTDIFIKKVKEQGWHVDIETAILQKFIKKNMTEFKYYGRDMETLLIYTKISHGRKQFGKSEETKRHIILENLEDGFKMYQKHKQEKEKEKVSPAMYAMFC